MLAKTTAHRSTRNVLQVDRDGELLAFTAKVLYNIWMFEMLHCVDLNVECCNHLFDTLLVLLGDFLIDFDLLNGQELTSRRVHAQIDSSVSAFANQLTANDLECRLSLGCILTGNLFLRNRIKRAETITGLGSDL